MNSHVQRFCLSLLFLVLLVTGQEDDLLYKPFTITTTFDGETDEVCGKSVRVRLRHTLQNGVNFYGLKYLEPDPDSGVQIQIEFDTAGELFDSSFRRRLGEESRGLVVRRYSYTYKGSGALICRSCNPDDSDRRLSGIKTQDGSIRARNVQTNESSDFEALISSKLTQDVQFWVKQMNLHEGKIGCLGTGDDVHSVLRFID